MSLITQYYDTMQAADLYIDDEGEYDINIHSDLFHNNKLLKFNNKDYVFVKVILSSHYNCVLINNKRKTFELFDPGGSHHLTKKHLNAYKKIFQYYPISIVQHENLQKHDHDCFCQTWVYVWLYYRTCLEKSIVQFKRTFQNKNSLSFITSVHMHAINCHNNTSKLEDIIELVE